ncbi:F-box associated domain type 1 [Arabidopsis thaliana x Arabidopsis arenosa]|uniref:F-box associated domain type 1 n=1 Tax=Arabidopsis thaliana x Arabidopsis arenosa TaxID=1240361 RepID=A0A8T2C4X2_9BRAS|nr:F-box associated domain type 1 [Arabidopsis thaliana x Arabidopsis arenosa]
MIEKLPCELIEETLSRVPPESLVRFRTVSKKWNALFDDKMFINNHKMTFRFILATKSKFYSVSITPKIEVRELTLDIPGLESHKPKDLIDCNGFLLCGMDKEAVVWNPWLRQTRLMKLEVNQPSLCFNGIGYEYDNMRLEGSGYKTLVSYRNELNPTRSVWKIHDFASNSWKDKELAFSGSSGISLLASSSVSLNGILYWVASYLKNNSSFVLVYFNFSNEKVYKFSDLPCGENHHSDVIVLRIFMEDRFSLLKQCHLTKKIEIWVTKNKIKNCCSGDVEWMNFTEVSTPNLPDLVKPSYFIDHKKLVVCSCDETGKAWIYVMGDNKLISKIQIDSVVDPWPLHCTCFPSLVPVPRSQTKEAASFVVL